MRELGHSRGSILKADIETQVFDVVVLEIHGFQLSNDRAEGLSTIAQLIRNVDKLSLYMYHREAIIGCSPCAEFGFPAVLDD
eukprot:m51a1_g1355 hypothetical protein (82) ;mRNA; r:369123-369411